MMSRCSLEIDAQGKPWAWMNVQSQGPEGSSLILALRPYNPEGVQFIKNASYDPEGKALAVNNDTRVLFSNEPAHVLFSDYGQGDVLHKLDQRQNELAVNCKVGMATAAVIFPFQELADRQEVTIRTSLPSDEYVYGHKRCPRPAPRLSWSETMDQTCNLRLPDYQLNSLYENAVHTLVLLSAKDVVPGPYTYRRFWFRDACFMLHALLNLGFVDSVGRIIKAFPLRQKKSGYFQSQAGEWDSNGQVLWLLDRYEQLSKRQLDPKWIPSIQSAVKWIRKKRTSTRTNAPHAGLLPAGFSAEHLGPNDYYYWDNFWAVAGLHSAASLFRRHGLIQDARFADHVGNDLLQTLWKSLEAVPDHRKSGGIPASPYRRLDAGAVGSLVADYPLQITPAGDKSIINTVDYLVRTCFHQGGFFQDMIHSGINPYLTLCIAQTLLRNQDLRCIQMLRTVADLASPTGQWPEAIHPLTYGGCMGDGQHGWAASEWIMMLRNLFIREEKDALILGSGLDPAWLESKEPLEFGPTLTPFGRISVFAQKTEHQGAVFSIHGDVNPEKILVEARFPGHSPIQIHALDRQYKLTKK
jgi:hypothetical protein